MAGSSAPVDPTGATTSAAMKLLEAEGADGAGGGTTLNGTSGADAEDGSGGKNPGVNYDEPRYRGREVVDVAIWLVVLAARIAASWGGMKGATAGDVAEAGRAAEKAEGAPEELMAMAILAAARQPRRERRRPRTGGGG